MSSKRVFVALVVALVVLCAAALWLRRTDVVRTTSMPATEAGCDRFPFGTEDWSDAADVRYLHTPSQCAVVCPGPGRCSQCVRAAAGIGAIPYVRPINEQNQASLIARPCGSPCFLAYAPNLRGGAFCFVYPDSAIRFFLTDADGWTEGRSDVVQFADYVHRSGHERDVFLVSLDTHSRVAYRSLGAIVGTPIADHVIDSNAIAAAIGRVPGFDTPPVSTNHVLGRGLRNADGVVAFDGDDMYDITIRPDHSASWRKMPDEDVCPVGGQPCVVAAVPV